MDHRVTKVIKVMENNLHRRISIAELGRAVNLSPWRLCHIFKEGVGTSPLQYLKTLRINKARVLAESTFLNMKQIMNRVGIRDESHFVKDFRKAHGITPVRYRLAYLSTRKANSRDSKIGQEIAISASKR